METNETTIMSRSESGPRETTVMPRGDPCRVDEGNVWFDISTSVKKLKGVNDAADSYAQLT
jgi:hypothetical protein